MYCILFICGPVTGLYDAFFMAIFYIVLSVNSVFISDTLIKLMEYGEDDDDVDDSSEEPLPRSTQANGVQKPFWAL